MRQLALTGKTGLWARLLFKLIRDFQPSLCLELGTNLGFSAAYQAAALRLNQKGRLVTLEGDPPLASLAERNLRRLNLNQVEPRTSPPPLGGTGARVKVVTGRFQDTLEQVLKTQAPIDYAFIDGHHDRDATIRYFQQISPFLSPRAFLVFDDISWSEGMRQAWKHIQKDQRVAFSVDAFAVGFCQMK